MNVKLLQRIRIISVSFLLLFMFLTTINSYSQKGKEKVLKETNIEQLTQQAKIYKQRSIKEKKKAVEMAREKGWIIRKEFENGKVMEIQRVENGKPVYYITYNLNAAKTISTNEVWDGGTAGLSLSGSGMAAGVWDGGAVLTSHQEFEGRASQQDGASDLSNHATHVSGTVGAGGVQSDAKGMAHEADIHAYDWNYDISEMSTAASNGLLVSNHSYGIPAGYSWNGSSYVWYGDETISTEEDYSFGFYNADCADWDELANNAPYYQMVVAAGNDRGEGPGNGTYPDDGEADNGYDCIAGKALAKNVIAVGNVLDISSGYSDPSDVVSNSSSSWGPADDGRVKPDISANGTQLYSSVSTGDTDYSSYSGTSMASPSVTGSLLLLQEHYNELYGEFMKAATLKGLIIHTADEAGANDGPDYKFGWGLMNTERAANIISEKDNSSFIKEETLSGGNTYTFKVYSAGNSPLRVTLTWTDPAGTPVSAQLDPRDPMLVNDLDMRVENPSGTIYKPYVLDPENPSNAAQNADNDVDNVEKIEIDNPQTGVYTITISHKNSLSGGSQDFSLITSDIVANSPGNFIASALTNTSTELSWDQNIDGDDVMIAASTERLAGVPTQGQVYSVGDSVGNGEIIYIGQQTSYEHVNLQSGTYYYYKAWSVDENDNYSTAVEDSAKTKYDVIFEDDFESDKGWSLSGEFERTAPKGLGGSDAGNPDPSNAYQGANVLGTDLTGLGGSPGNLEGDYAAGLNDREYKAISPVINCQNYSKVRIDFQRWLNVEEPANDSVQIDVSNDGGATWQNVWYNDKEYTENDWKNVTLDISSYADDTGQVVIRYTVGETDQWGGHYSGWNIDNFRITGKIPRYSLTYHVTDGTNPLENAFIEIGDTTGFTDANGYITFNGITKGNQISTVRKPLYSNVIDTHMVNQDDTVDIVMNSGTATYKVGFTILNGDTTVSDATVDFNNETLLTDNQGKAVFDSVAIGDYPFSVIKNGNEETGMISVIDRNVDTTVIFTYNVTFSVDDGSEPIEGSTVSLQGYGDSLTNASGEVVFERVIASSDINYEIAADGYVKETGTVDVITSDVTENVSLSPGNKIDFVVKSDADNPIEGATIATNDDTIYSNTSGIATIYLPNGDYSYSVAKEGFYSAAGNFSVSSADITENVTLARKLNVLFTIDDGVEPLNDAQVTFAGITYMTDTLGKVSVDTSKGTYNYEISKDGYYNASGSVSITDSDIQKDITISRINTIIFAVTSESDGAEINGAEIDFAGEILKTDNTGKASLDTANGTYNYTVSKDQYDQYSGSIEVMNSDTTLNIQLAETSTVLGDFEDDNSIRIYPNPSNGKVYIEGEVIEGATIELRNVLGNQLLNKQIQNQDKVSVSLTEYPKGIYFIIIQKDNSRYSRKIILR